jgi:iron-sulfur cluster assembly protein
MALDEQRDDDEVFDDRGLTYIVHKELFEQIKPLKVEYVNSPMGSGFSISSNAQTGAGCGESCSC